jgi:TolA-binding protein
MRKVLISVAAAASALALAAPASAQYYPAPQGPVNGYGYNNNHGSVRSLQVRIDRLQQRIARFDSRDRISEREARRLREESRDIEKRLHRSSRNGLNPQEYASVNYRIQRLEQRIYRDANDGNRWGNNDQWRDRDRDGRNDRWEDDRGRDHD